MCPSSWKLYLDELSSFGFSLANLEPDLEVFGVDDNGDSVDDDLSHYHLPIPDWGRMLKFRVLWMGGSFYYLRTGLLGTTLCLKID